MYTIMYMFCDKEVFIMLNTNITQFRKNVFAMLENTIKYNEPINISTKSGNAILLSEEEYNGIMATLELSSNAELKKTLIDGMNTPLSECISEDEVVW
ncbi:hypothetical protein HMPREF1032_03217 [Subdoligranulum sp. 4_3_54A2FAA]|nr:hypothetical protein HMPREF1032_03217 [Subdoligranulum sp. 4_3_54A2FAA]